ncbi:MAG TPA: 2-C-methyl-D-erythritol 4-phosphate cytidylyltransferase [Actinomycetota bacterium]|nr:2-C-methyl-D-erythritol 4-phosphate cytidylyltransferase [Actinomycetota bacterium]
MTVVGIVPAGGSGKRLGADRPKAFVVCAGRPMVEWSVEALSAVCSRVVVAVPPGLERRPDRVAGGASRSASVRNALAVAPEATVVVVHDAARPLVTSGLVRECLEALDGVDGVVAAMPMSDTVHVSSTDRLVHDTPDRSTLWSAQTPQVFHADILRRALGEGDSATDEAALVAAVGGTVRLIEGPSDNIKVTTPTDLRLAEAILRDRC